MDGGCPGLVKSWITWIRTDHLNQRLFNYDGRIDKLGTDSRKFLPHVSFETCDLFIHKYLQSVVLYML